MSNEISEAARDADSVLDGKDPHMDRAVKAYIKMRDARSALKAQFEKDDKAIKDQQEILQNFFLEKMQRMGGITAIATEFGTVYQDIDVKSSCSDWGALFEFIAKNDAWDLMEKRLGKLAVKKFMEDNEGRLPPGVNVFKEATVKIRRK